MPLRALPLGRSFQDSRLDRASEARRANPFMASVARSPWHWKIALHHSAMMWFGSAATEIV
jgi:hypothetical protein